MTEPRTTVAVLPENKILDDAFASSVETELSLWLAALRSFLHAENLSAAETNNNEQSAVRDWSGEMRVVAWGLLKCSQLLSGLPTNSGISGDAVLADLQKLLHQSVALCESLAAEDKIAAPVWFAWCARLADELKNSTAAQLWLEQYETERRANLPPALESLKNHADLKGIVGADVLEIFERFCGFLDNLQLVEKMLKLDQPLKPALLIFALLNGETRDLLAQAEQTLKILPPESALHEILDGTIYILPMELRKVYGYELVGVGEMRQSPAIFARVENACGLLKDCFQQAVIALAQVFAPTITTAEVFPNHQTKLEQSLVLRRELWLTLKLVQQTEKSLEPEMLKNINVKLSDFRQNTMPFLMFKDCDTTERFIEEIARTRRSAEIAQVLHRFGAYLETLMGQVNMRNVLAAHPFDYSNTNTEK